MRKIAIVGAGFCGLATAWHLLAKQDQVPMRIVVFDPQGIGGGASGVSAGLLHPYAGLHCKLNWMGIAGWQAACHLLKIASAALGCEVADYSGMLRLALTESQINDYSTCAKTYDDVQWLDRDGCAELAPGVLSKGGVFIRSAITVYPQKYLQGLWQACAKSGAEFERKAVSSMEELSSFDAIVVAAGASSTAFSALTDLPIRPIKGQILEIAWPKMLEPLGVALNSQAYVVMEPNRKSCYAGSTFERDFSSFSPDLASAATTIMPKVLAFYPALRTAEVIDCKAGIRASTKDRRPILRKFRNNGWVLTGMGSKGLLYHGLFAQKLADLICE